MKSAQLIIGSLVAVGAVAPQSALALGCMFKDEFQQDPNARLDLLPPVPTATVRTTTVGNDETYSFDRRGRLLKYSNSAKPAPFLTEYEYAGEERLPFVSRTESAMDGNSSREYRRDNDGYIIETKDNSASGNRVFAYDIVRQPNGQIVITHKWAYRQRHTFDNGLRVFLESWDDVMLNFGQGSGGAKTSQKLLAYHCERRNANDGTWTTIERRVDGDQSGIGEVNRYDSTGRRILNWYAYFNQPLSDEMGGTTTRYTYENDDRGNWVRSTACKFLRSDESDLTCHPLPERNIKYW